ncbi:MAG: YHYH domain-containing protein [Deltaproteobacteria bacterium]|nr:YHYH domain-containing protein [Deltaproteobacteria bacterium]MBI3390347.1 YHYH domain-containing protein [Deltaproteobacteria bacterium]
MKGFILAAAATAALLVVIVARASAHGGGLDAYGCHHNRKAGGYHCHRGSLAGQSFSSKEEMLKALDTSKARVTPK